MIVVVVEALYVSDGAYFYFLYFVQGSVRSFFSFWFGPLHGASPPPPLPKKAFCYVAASARSASYIRFSRSLTIATVVFFSLVPAQIQPHTGTQDNRQRKKQR